MPKVLGCHGHICHPLTSARSVTMLVDGVMVVYVRFSHLLITCVLASTILNISQNKKKCQITRNQSIKGMWKHMPKSWKQVKSLNTSLEGILERQNPREMKAKTLLQPHATIPPKWQEPLLFLILNEAKPIKFPNSEIFCDPRECRVYERAHTKENLAYL